MENLVCYKFLTLAWTLVWVYFCVLLNPLSVTAHASHGQCFIILTALEKKHPRLNVEDTYQQGYSGRLASSYNPFHRRLLEQGSIYPVHLLWTTVSVYGGQRTTLRSQVVLLDPTVHFTNTHQHKACWRNSILLLTAAHLKPTHLIILCAIPLHFYHLL